MTIANLTNQAIAAKQPTATGTAPSIPHVSVATINPQSHRVIGLDLSGLQLPPGTYCLAVSGADGRPTVFPFKVQVQDAGTVVEVATAALEKAALAANHKVMLGANDSVRGTMNVERMVSVTEQHVRYETVAFLDYAVERKAAMQSVRPKPASVVVGPNGAIIHNQTGTPAASNNVLEDLGVSGTYAYDHYRHGWPNEAGNPGAVQQAEHRARRGGYNTFLDGAKRR